MFDNLGKKAQTVFLFLIVALLSVVMGVLGFGQPGADGCAADGPTSENRVAVEHYEHASQQCGMCWLRDKMFVQYRPQTE